jgi:hypothetical protein
MPAASAAQETRLLVRFCMTASLSVRHSFNGRRYADRMPYPIAAAPELLPVIIGAWTALVSTNIPSFIHLQAGVG